MSKTIDERVVSMRFDNKNFESNVQTSLSTLDKLKRSLNLTGASKGLENINSAAKNVNMSSLGSAVETVRAKFSALEVMGVTALANITNSAVNAGKRMISALTIDPVKTGFNEYELKMDSIKTIMASTGESVETVNKYLDELNEYSDRTIYSFSDMTQNIGKFTNAGVKLEDAVLAMKGISNEAAVSGANANEASRAMYNLAQSMSMGFVQYIDWKSIENANMATVEFKKNLADMAVKLGVVSEANGEYTTSAGEAYSLQALFKDGMKDQWLTTDVLVKTLRDYADETTDIGKKAYAAAQDVTKLSQVFDIAKERAQSGWARTWEILFGDIEKAKALFTPLSDFLNKVIDGMSDFRNNLLEWGLTKSPWAVLSEKIDASGLGTIKKYADSITNISDKLGTFQSVVSNVWRGDYGNMWPRWNKLDAEGYNSDVIQDLVNLGYDHKITVEDVEASYKKYGLTLDKSTKSTEKMAASIDNLSDAQLKEAGFTDQEIKMFHELQKEAKRTGKPIKELIDEMSETDGRTLLIDALKNAGSGLVGVFTALKNAWVDVFPPMSAIQLFNIIKGINELSEKLRLTDKDTGELTDTAKKLQRTFKGVFALLDIVTTLIGGPLKIAFKVVMQILKMFDRNILDVTAGIGDVIVGFRDWLDSVLDVSKAFEVVSKFVNDAKDAVAEWFSGFMAAEDKPKYIIDSITNALKTALEYVKNNAANIGQTIWDGINNCLKGMGIDTSGFVAFFANIKNEIQKFLTSFKDTGNISGDIITGLVNGIKNGIGTVVGFIVELGKSIIQTIKDVLGIHSPSTEMAEVGEFTMEGFLQGIQNGFGAVLNTLKDIVSKCVEVFKGVDFGSLLASAMNIGGLLVFNKIGTALQNFSEPFAGIGSVLESASGAIATFSQCMKKFTSALSFNIKIQAIKSLAIAIALIVGSIWVLTLLDWGKVWMAILQLTAVLGLMVAATILIGKFGSGSAKDFAAFSLVCISLSVSMLLMAAAMKIIESIDPDKAGQVITGMAALFIGIALVIAVLTKTFDGQASKTVAAVGTTILKLAVSLLILGLLVKLLGSMDPDAFKQGLTCLALLSAIIIVLIYVSKAAGKSVAGIGKAISQIAVAILLMGLTVKLLAGLKEEDIIKGTLAILAFSRIIVGLMAATRLVGGNNIDALGKTILSIAASILIMAIVVKLLAGMKPSEILKGRAAITAFSLIIVGLIAATNLVTTKDLEKVGTTLLMMSISIAILAAVAIILGQVETGKLIKGIAAVAALGVIMALMIASTVFAKDCMGNLIVMTVAIALMTGCVIALSMIDPSKLWPAVAALGILMALFAGLIAVTALAKGSIGTLIVLTAAFALLAAALYLLAGLPVDKVFGAAASLSMLLISLTASLTILSMTGGISLKAVVSLGIMMIVVGLLAGVLYLLSGLPIGSTITTATALSTMLISIAAVCTIMSLLGVNVVSAASAALGLGAFIGILAGVLLALGALTQIPGVNELISSGGETLAAIGYAIGNFIGSIIGGLGAGLTSGLPEMATNLSSFMILLTPFIMGAKMLDASAMDGVRALAETILIITAANLLEGITSFLTGGSSMTKFAEELIPFGEAMVKFSKVVSGNIDSEAVNAAANAGKVMVELQNTLPGTGGVFQMLAGEKSLEDFGNQLVPFGTAMVRFSSVVAGNIDAEAVTAAANAGKTMVELQKTLPNTGGVFQMLTGEQDMETFGDQLVPFGTAMVRFSSIVAGNIDGEAVTAAANAGKTMAELQKTLPETGGVVQFLDGTKDMGMFTQQLVPFGTAIVRFSKVVTGNIDNEAVTAAANAGKTMAEMQKTLPETGGVFEIFTGSQDMSKFGEQLVKFGEGMVKFSDTVTGGINQEAITTASSVGMSVLEILNTFPDEVNFDRITNGLTNFGDSVVSFSETVAGNIDSEAITSVANVGKTLAETAATMPDEVNLASLTNGLKSFGDGIIKFSDQVSDSINQEAITAATTAGKKIVEMIAGIPIDLDLSSFSTGMFTLGNSMKTFSADLSEVDKDTVNKAVEIGSSVGDMVANHIPSYIDIGDFVNNLPGLGRALAAFSNSVSGDNTFDPDTLKKATDAGSSIGDMVRDHIPQYINIDDFIDKAPKVASAIRDFYKKISSRNEISKTTIQEATDAGSSIGDMVRDHIPQYIDIDDFIANLPKLGSVLSTFSEEMSNVSGSDLLETIDSLKKMMSSLEDIGTTGVEKFIKPFSDSKKKLTGAIDTMANAAIDALDKNGNHDKFYSIGKNLVQGFADGISVNTYIATAKAKAMANAAEKAAKDALDINSPSKVFRKIGKSVPEGFAQGIDRLSGLASKSSEEMAKNSVNSTLSAVSYIADVINSDIDAQPTIRPVLDLTNVRSGANAIGGMLSGRTLSINTDRVGAVSASMSNRKNGNDEIVSAIKALRSDIANTPRNTYSINGISYDDGSNISTAVRDLVRAAKIERRI